MKKNELFRRCDIAVNRNCNVRCNFCYAKDTGYDLNTNMSFGTFEKIVSLCDELKIGRIAFFGGEPTVCKDIFEYLKRIPKHIGIGIVTNAIMLSDEELCKKYIESGVVSFSLSIKAHNREKYREITQVDAFDKVLKGIENVSRLGVDFSVSYVITNDNVEDIPEMIKIAKKYGAKRFFFSFCRNLNLLGIKDDTYIKGNNPFEIARRFEKILPIIKNMGVKISYSINDPLCVHTESFVRENIIDFPFPCHVYNESILSFDDEGNLIPCHSMYPIKVGKVGEDFVTKDELLEFRMSEKYRTIYKKLRGLPSDDCTNCGALKNCYGRCVCNWTNYSFDQLSKMGKLTRFCSEL